MENAKLDVPAGLAAWILGDTLIVIWKEPLNQARWDWFPAQLAALGTKTPHGALSLFVITETSLPPDGPLRKRMQTDFHDLGPKLRKLVAVPVGNSIWLSIVRTIVRTTLLLSGEAKRQVVVPTLDQGIAEIRTAAEAATPSRAMLRGAVDRLLLDLDVTGLSLAKMAIIGDVSSSLRLSTRPNLNRPAG